MEIPRKLEIFDKTVESITRHDEEDSVVLKAAIGAMRKKLDAEEKVLDERNTKRIKAIILGA